MVVAASEETAVLQEELVMQLQPTPVVVVVEVEVTQAIKVVQEHQD